MRFILLYCILVFGNYAFSQKKILFFASHEEAYYSEVIVAKAGLEALGYQVDLRSANNQDIGCYMAPANTTIEETANSLAGSSFSNFSIQFEQNFGANWDNSLDAIQAFIPVQGSIMDLNSMDDYEALVIAGGTGVLDYRVDGSYPTQGSGQRLLTSAQVQACAEKLNSLAVDAMMLGKPILAQCHGASLPVFWRIPNTSGSGAETLGFSFLKGSGAAGFPDTETALAYDDLNVAHLESNRVSIGSPNNALIDEGKGNSKIITSRDWYPQTVSYATRTLLNVLESFPHPNDMNKQVKLLILHGGAIDPNNCAASNPENDVPCNYGAGVNLPADYTNIKTLLESSSMSDSYQFSISDLNLLDSVLPFDNENIASIQNYFSDFDVVLFFKHWSSGVTNALQTALQNFAEDGGGILGLHHALYNDVSGNLNKDILVSELFGAESAMATWSGNLASFNVYTSNHGHFVTSYGINYITAAPVPQMMLNSPAYGNLSFSTQHQVPIFDEIYGNFNFTGAFPMGRNENEILPLLTNDANPQTQGHTSGFARLVNENLDEKAGKLVYFAIGERQENFAVNTTYSQMVRNAAFWVAKNTPDTLGFSDLTHSFSVYPNPSSGIIHLNSKQENAFSYSVYSADGILQKQTICNQQTVLDLSELNDGFYFLKINFGTNSETFKITLIRK